MLNYIIGRLLRMIPQVFLISILAFIIIQLPPGDYLTAQILRLQATGVTVNQDQIKLLGAQVVCRYNAVEIKSLLRVKRFAI